MIKIPVLDSAKALSFFIEYSIELQNKVHTLQVRYGRYLR